MEAVDGNLVVLMQRRAAIVAVASASKKCATGVALYQSRRLDPEQRRDAIGQVVVDDVKAQVEGRRSTLLWMFALYPTAPSVDQGVTGGNGCL